MARLIAHQTPMIAAMIQCPRVNANAMKVGASNAVNGDTHRSMRKSAKIGWRHVHRWNKARRSARQLFRAQRTRCFRNVEKPAGAYVNTRAECW